MGRRRRQKVRRRPQKRIPDVYDCPACGIAAIQIVIHRDKSFASVKCGNCGISVVLEDITPLTEPVDIYGDFIDEYYRTQKAEV
ncbi:MAG: hypothetical protein EAX81_03555 [Candidatus Thorarchaeota archaeon]|nr:hypothetical protein [Candidatus Thorarchaeota archaeon]